MKKFFVFLIVFLCVICLSGCGNENKKSVLNKITKKVNNCSGYQLEANMELINNDESYKYDVLVSYEKKDKFRVSLKNKINNHEQIILKNDDGVYVLTPSLNKSFKFQSKWPYNNSQSYLIQSVLNDINNDANLTMKKIKGNYLFTSTVNYKNNSNLVSQEVIFDKSFNIKSVTVYDNEKNPQIKVNFKNVDMKAKFKKNYFILDENMKTYEASDDTSLQVTKLEEAVYPMYLPTGTYLESEKIVELDEGSRIILTFAGESSFMLVEENVIRQDEFSVIPTNGELEIIADSIAIIGDSSISWISDNIEYYLVSSDLTKGELLNVAKSISVMPVGK